MKPKNRMGYANANPSYKDSYSNLAVKRCDRTLSGKSAIAVLICGIAGKSAIALRFLLAEEGGWRNLEKVS